MRIVFGSLEEPHLTEADDFGSLCIELNPRQRIDLMAVPKSVIAELDGSHAWVLEFWLRARIAEQSGNGWQGRYDDMLNFARGRGWLREAPLRIRAHIS